MNSLLKCLMLSLLLLSVSACKNDQKATENLSPNDSKAFEGTGAIDVSDKFTLNQSQLIPEMSSAFIFKSQNTLKIYVATSDPKNQIIFNENAAIAIFSDTTSVVTNFRVNGLDYKNENTLVSVSTVPTQTKTNPYRPSFVMTIPKKDLKGMPVVKLNGKEIPITTME